MEQEVVNDSSIIAIVAGQPFTEIPADLFIPPDALEVLLDTFSGPLDLLLYLIRKQNLDILNIPMTLITQQYMQYIQLMKEKRLELAADYLVMAALLMEIKSRMLLPPSISEEEIEDEDPRMALVRRLQLYEQYKEAATQLDNLPRKERDIFAVAVDSQAIKQVKQHPAVNLSELTLAFITVLERQDKLVHHQIKREPLSVRARMNSILEQLNNTHFTHFTYLFSRQEGRMGLVVSLLAILELSRLSLITIMQASNFSPIHIKAIENE
ncbi:segregation and condensation protein A (plasmid) [Legionella adelaidensis]|uniref:Segregation and condensation protein A n=1 Tax=Legionella adelaidensis TaxID=45056 RepID=A0A0W0R4H3_9GAMM|nr:segregation/condensation protein A [Legionella adelaidensis]KTC65930.1 segregation and condensation protein A [Legionella adelaidensis]VEH85550.1 segregation and condensation protein A [Legionella adelaidensis]